MSEHSIATLQSKPMLSFWQIWNMSFGFLGIQFGFALQNANVSRIFQTLGANIDDIPILWIAAPVTGLIVQPLIGFFSDRTWGKLGRRRPYFLTGALLASVALCIMPNSPTLWIAAGMLWILDASINISMEPFRAFVGDNLPNEQRTRGFAMQSFFIGAGAVVGSYLPYMLTNWFGVPNTAAEGLIPPSVKWSFYAGAIVFFAAVLWTVIRSKEYSPAELEAFSTAEGKQDFVKVEESAEKIARRGTWQTTSGVILLVLGAVMTYFFMRGGVEKELFVLSVGIVIVGLLFLTSGILQKAKYHGMGFVIMVNDLVNLPKTMKQLAFVQFFSWFGLFAMWIYATAAVTSHIFGTTDTSSKIYNDGADWVAAMFSVYNGVAALVAFLLPVLAKMTNRKVTHAICLIAGGLGLSSIYFINDQSLLIISMIGIGFAWASILSMPYAILSGALPASKMGYYMGVFNFFIVIPQIVAASILGLVIGHFFAHETVYAMLIGGASFLAAAVLTMFVDDKD
jgi:maltose/moltooligosaccharide transporter